MPSTATQLVPSSTIPATTTAMFTAALVTQISNLSLTNPSSSPVTVTLYLVPSGGTAGVTNQISYKPLNVNETWTGPEWVGKVMKKGDALTAVATTAGEVVISVSGVVFS